MLRDYQMDWVRRINAAIKAGNQCVLGVLPTGGGKTVCMSYMAGRMVEYQRHVGIYAHRKELVRQISATLQRDGIYHGIQHPDWTPDYHAPVQVGSVQTVANRLHLLRAPDYVFFDEGHHAVADTWRGIMATWATSKYIGVTATPCRTDGRGLGRNAGGVYDEMVLGPTPRQLVEIGHLVEPVIYCPGETFTLEGVSVVGGDYVKSQLSQKMNTNVVTGDALGHFMLHNQDGKARGVVFCVDVKHAEDVADMYNAAGVRTVALYGNMPGNERDQAIRDFDAGIVQVLTSCDLIGEGFDIPAIDIVQCLRPTLSLSLWLQMIGRGMRKSEGKTRCIVLDHVGNVHKHGGGPMRDRVWTLDGEQKRRSKKTAVEDEFKIERCSMCFATYPESEPQCPYCGHKELKKKSGLKTKAGVLVEYVESAAEIKRKEKEAKAAEREAVRSARERRKAAIEASKAARVASVRAAIGDLSGADLRAKCHELATSAKTVGDLYVIGMAAGLVNAGKGNNKLSAWVFATAKRVGIEV